VQRVTITLDDDLLAAVDALASRRGYASRSEAFRDIVRDSLREERTAAADTPCVGTFSYVYDHATRELAQRLTHAQHDNHDIVVAGLHVHLDHASCLEVSILRGTLGAVRSFADGLSSQRGVRHAQLHLIPAEVSTAAHRHDGGSPAHHHVRA